MRLASVLAQLLRWSSLYASPSASCVYVCICVGVLHSLLNRPTTIDLTLAWASTWALARARSICKLAIKFKYFAYKSNRWEISVQSQSPKPTRMYRTVPVVTYTARCPSQPLSMLLSPCLQLFLLLVCSVELCMFLSQCLSLSLPLNLYLSSCVCAVSYNIRALVTCHLAGELGAQSKRRCSKDLFPFCQPENLAYS